MGKKIFTILHSKTVFAAAVRAGFIVFLHVAGFFISSTDVVTMRYFGAHLWYRLKI